MGCVCVEGVAGQVTPKGSPVPESRLAQVFACVCVRVCVRVRVVRACARAGKGIETGVGN